MTGGFVSNYSRNLNIDRCVSSLLPSKYNPGKITARNTSRSSSILFCFLEKIEGLLKIKRKYSLQRKKHIKVLQIL